MDMFFKYSSQIISQTVGDFLLRIFLLNDLGYFFFWVQKAGDCNGLCHSIWVAVCWRTAILEVAFLLLAYLARDADAGTSVCHSGRKLFNAGCFMETCETSFVVIPPMWVIHTDVRCVVFAQLLNGLLDVSVIREIAFINEWIHCSSINLKCQAEAKNTGCMLVANFHWVYNLVCLKDVCCSPDHLMAAETSCPHTNTRLWKFALKAFCQKACIIRTHKVDYM